MSNKTNPYTLVSRKEIYQNPWIHVVEDKVIRPDGTEGMFATIDGGSGVSIIALDKAANVYLIKEYYYVVEQWGIQLPAGGIEKNETPLQAAKKELQEEAGVVAQKWQQIAYLNPLTMIVKCPSYIFLATDLTEVEKSEPDISVIKVPLQKAYEMVMNGEITFSNSCTAILMVKNMLDNGTLKLL